MQADPVSHAEPPIETIASGSPRSMHGRAESGSSVNQINVGLGGATLVMLAVMTFIIGACGVVMGLNLSRQQTMTEHYDDLRRQYRMTEMKLDDLAVAAHLRLPGDFARGPQGNPDPEAFKQPKKVK